MPSSTPPTAAPATSERALAHMDAAGLRPTPSRRRVVEALALAARPVTLPEILRADPGLAQSSTYRNLSELIEAGVVHRIDAGDEHSHYELADELTTHHHHLICTGCGRVTDVELGDEVELAVHAATCAAEATGFEVHDHRVDLVGRCADCRRA